MASPAFTILKASGFELALFFRSSRGAEAPQFFVVKELTFILA
jgi:hypothetical protein